jgi:hypothetical protein
MSNETQHKVLNYPKQLRATRFHHDTGLVLNSCEIKILKDTKQVKYSFKQLTVIISNATHYVVENEYGHLEVLEKIKKSYYQSFRTVNRVKAHETRWGIKSMSDYISAYSISTFSEKVTKTRIKKALYKFIQKEAYFYSGLEHEIEAQLNLIETGKQ